MTERATVESHPPGRESAPGAPRLELAQPLEQRRLQAYLALMAGDILAIFGGFAITGYLYLGQIGFDRAEALARLLLPVFLTVALYNGAYSLGTLQSVRQGMLRGLNALGVSAAVVVFIAYYTKSSADFSRVLFTIGTLLSTVLVVWMRAQLRAFIHWRCGERMINELLIDDGGPKIALVGAMRADARRLHLSPALDDPAALNRIGALLHNIDRVVVSCPPARRAAWVTILKGANIDGEVVDDTVALLGAHGARIVDGHGFLRVSVAAGAGCEATVRYRCGRRRAACPVAGDAARRDRHPARGRQSGTVHAAPRRPLQPVFRRVQISLDATCQQRLCGESLGQCR